MDAALNVGEDVGPAQRLRHPESPGQAQDQAATLVMRDPVARRDKNRFDALVGSQHGPDAFAAVPESGASAAVVGSLAMIPHQSRLGAPDGGQVQEHTHMAGQAEAAGMGEPVPFQQQQIRARGQPGDGSQQHRCLAEGEQAGHVREAGAPHRRDLLHTSLHGHGPAGRQVPGMSSHRSQAAG